MQRYFSNEIINNRFYLSREDSYHLINVMRAKRNDLVEVVCDKKLYICKIIDNNVNKVVCQIDRCIDKEKLETPKVIIVQALVSENKMDLILQKCTELGVNEIIPLKTINSKVNIDSKVDKKINRWQIIVKEASEQSKRIDIPIVREVMTIDEINKLDGVKIFCSVNEVSNSIKRVLSNTKIDDTLILVIGPEGGFTDLEESKLINGGFVSVSLGNNVLRTETASIYLLSVIAYHFMR